MAVAAARAAFSTKLDTLNVALGDWLDTLAVLPRTFVLVTVAERADDATANLLGPIVVNRHTRSAVQAVLATASHLILTLGLTETWENRATGRVYPVCPGVAAGRFDGFWEQYLSAWDIAAGVLLIREAGGVVTDLSGRDVGIEHTGLVAGNPVIHAWLLDTLTAAG